MPLSTSHIEETLSSREEYVLRLLSSILNLNLQHEINEKHIISVINKFLSTAKNRREGLQYLSLVISNCSSSVIADNALNWISHCVTKFEDDVLRELKLRVLGVIIEVGHNESEFNKKFVSDYISKVFDNCIISSHVNPYECKAALKTLAVLMQYYPSSFGSHRQKIENFLLIFLDSDNDELVQNAAIGFHYLQQVGSAGVNGINHKLNFTHEFHKLCRTVHKLYDSFFETEREIFQWDRLQEENVFEFQDDPSSNPQVLMHNTSRRIKNVLKFIETMITTKFPVAKETKPKELLEVLIRGTSMHKCISGENMESLETYQFSFLLTEIQCTLLRLLKLFIIWYQTICLPFSYTISKVLVDCIERSHNCDCFKYDSLYQESSYRALSQWLSICKSSLHTQFQSQILACILKDVTPVKTQITLTISEAASGKKSQKAKRRAMTNRIIASGNQTSTHDSSTLYEKHNEINTCKFALVALKDLLELTKLNVKSDLLKDLYKSVFDSLTSIQSSKPLHPYIDSQCQIKLYEVLVAIYHQNTLSKLPPLQTSLDILTRGTNNCNRFISEICQRGLRILEILCQPICPSLYLGVEKEDEDTEEMRKVREVIEVGEMVIEEGGADGESSVDYDASTDEFSANESFKRDKRSDSPIYEVNLPDTDPSIDDDLSIKGNSEEMEFEELDAGREGFSFQEEETEITLQPTVTAPSEDGNEVLESGSNEHAELQTVREESEDLAGSPDGAKEEKSKEDSSLEKRPDKSSENFEDVSEKDEDPIIFENVTSVEIHSNDLKNEATENIPPKEFDQDEQVEVTLAKREADEANSKTTEVENQQHEISPKESGFTNKEPEEADSTSLKMDPEEPPAKKAKINLEEHLEMGDVSDEAVVKGEQKKSEEGKNEDEDPDSSYLEDDSFVDEVKDY